MNDHAPQPVEPSDLSLVSTAALLDELFARHDHAAFAGLFIVGEDRSRKRLRWKGNHCTVAGLGASITKEALAAYDDEAEPDPNTVDGGPSVDE
jgi:hypothetical protein